MATLLGYPLTPGDLADIVRLAKKYSQRPVETTRVEDFAKRAALLHQNPPASTPVETTADKPARRNQTQRPHLPSMSFATHEPIKGPFLPHDIMRQLILLARWESSALQIAVKALTENLPDLLGFIEQACHQYQLPKQTSLDLRLAVEEASVNLIEHGYTGLQPGIIEIDFQPRDNQVLLTIVDFGREFDPTTYRPPDRSSEWDQCPVGGLGAFLIRQLMDEVRYATRSNPGQGNRLELIKKMV